jgi:hypothetical protein
MKLRSLQLAADPTYREKALQKLDELGLITIVDWEAISQEELLRTPGLSRRIIRLIDEGIERKRNPEKGAQAKQLFLWDGKIHNDDRLFILDLQPATKGGKDVWAVVTRWNHEGFPPYKVNDFETQIEAIDFIKKIEPQTPRISLDGKSLNPTPSYIEYLELMKKNGEPSSFAIYEQNKHHERKLMLEERHTSV